MSSDLDSVLARLRDACPHVRLHAPAPAGLLQADIPWDTTSKTAEALKDTPVAVRVQRQDLLIVRIEQTTLMLTTIPPTIEPAKAVAMSGLNPTTPPGRPLARHDLETATWYQLTISPFGHSVPTSPTSDILAVLLCDLAGVNPTRGASRISVERLINALIDHPDITDVAHGLAR